MQKREEKNTWDTKYMIQNIAQSAYYYIWIWFSTGLRCKTKCKKGFLLKKRAVKMVNDFILQERRERKTLTPAYQLSSRHKYVPESLKHHNQPDPSVNILINKCSVSPNKVPVFCLLPVVALSQLVVSPCSHYTKESIHSSWTQGTLFSSSKFFNKRWVNDLNYMCCTQFSRCVLCILISYNL